ncbi:hypothetical protein HJ581_0041660 [Rhodococcus opacus]|nr:hypothetical protein HJ581_0041660 [Rhodococcus opacus]
MEDQTGYICQVIDLIGTKDVAVWPSEEATDQFRSWVRNEVPETVWSDACFSWYKGNDGEAIVWPWFDTEHEAMFADLAFDDLELSISQNAQSTVSGSES